MRPNKIAQPPRPQQRTNSRDGRVNFAQQAEMNLRPEPKPIQNPGPRSNSYNRTGFDRPVSQEEVRSALTLLKAKRERERMQTQIVKPEPEYYQAPPLKKAQSYQPQQPPQTYEEIVAKEDKKPMQLNEYDNEFEEMIECPEGCGRKFKESALEKHVRVCKKVFQQKRKAFDTKEQRIINEDHAKLLLQKQSEEQQQQKQQQQKKPRADDRQIQGQKKPKWKVLSEQFRAALKQTKGTVLTHEEQVALQEEDDRVQCDYCGRKFNEKAAEKHIPSCKEKAKINQMKKQSSMPPPAPQKQQQQLNGTNSFPKQNPPKNLNGTNNTFNNTQSSTKRPPPQVQRKY